MGRLVHNSIFSEYIVFSQYSRGSEYVVFSQYLQYRLGCAVKFEDAFKVILNTRILEKANI